MTLEPEAVEIHGALALLSDASPGDVACVLRLSLGHNLLANCRACAIGCNEEIAVCAAAIAENRSHAAAVLHDALERLVEVIRLLRQKFFQRRVDVRPRAHD